MQKMHDRKNIGKIILDPSMEPKPETGKEATSGGNAEEGEKSSSP